MISTVGLVQLDDPASVRESGTQLASAAEAVATRADSVRSGWQGLGAHYSAPEQGLVLAAMNVPDEQAGELSDKTGRARTALATYADRLQELQARKSALISDIDAFYVGKAAIEADNADNNFLESGWDWVTGEDNDLLGREEDLSARAGQLQADKEAAERDCANAIGAIWGAPGYSAVDDTWVGDEHVYGMTADGYEQAALSGDTPWGHPDMWSEGDWTTKTFMFGRGAVRSVVDIGEFVGDATGINGAGQAKAVWSGIGQLGLDALVVSGPAAYLFTSPEQRAESGERLLGVGKGLIGWDTWDTSGWNTAGGLGLDAILAVGTGGTYAAGKGGLKGAMAAGGGGRLLAPLRGTRAGSLATSMRVTLSTRATTSLNMLNRLPNNLTNRFGGALDNLGTRPAYAGPGLPARGYPGSSADDLIRRFDRNDTPGTSRGSEAATRQPEADGWKWNDETRPLPGETRQEHLDRTTGIDRGDKRDTSGKYTGSDTTAQRYEADGVQNYADRFHREVVTDTKPRIRLDGGPDVGQLHRYYDGLEILGRGPDGVLEARGIEIKGPTAGYGGSQQAFDTAIKRYHGYGTYHGERIRVVSVKKYSFDGKDLYP